MSIKERHIMDTWEGAVKPSKEIREQKLILDNGEEHIEGIICFPAESKEKYPTVVIVHGFGGNYHFYTGNIARALAESGFAAYAFNLRNPDTRAMLHTSVLTEAETLSAVLDQIERFPWVDRKRLYLLGESQGGFVSAYVSAVRAGDPQKDDVRGLVLYYPAFVLQDDAKRRNPRWKEEGYEWPRTEVIGQNQVSGTYSCDALSFDIYDVVKAYAHPVLIVHGTADPVVPVSYSEKAVKTYKQAKLKVIENAGHGFYFGEPFEQSVRYTVDCLRKWSEDAFTMEDKAE